MRICVFKLGLRAYFLLGVVVGRHFNGDSMASVLVCFVFPFDQGCSKISEKWEQTKRTRR